jgi:hypothetical protein
MTRINGTCAGDLDDRIAAAFADRVQSGIVATLIAEAESAACVSGEAAERARERALDPALMANAVAEARREMDDAQFRCDRLKVALQKLQARLKEVKAEEENRRRRLCLVAPYDVRVPKRDHRRGSAVNSRQVIFSSRQF